jgi:hypothetical protein
MPYPKTIWTPDMRSMLLLMRAAGKPLLACANRIGVDYLVAQVEANRLGVGGRLSRGRRSGENIAKDNARELVAGSDYLNLPLRSLDEVLRLRGEVATCR